MPSGSSNVSEWMMTAESMASFPEFKEEEEKPSAAGMVESLLTSIAEITGTVVCMQIEPETFLNFGSYLYRFSAVIRELQLDNNNGLIPPDTTEVLQSLAKSINFAKTLVKRLDQNRAILNHQDSELTDILEDLEGVIRKVGKGLSLIVFPKQEDGEFVQIAARSLSKEMIDVHFVVGKQVVSVLGSQQQSSMELSMMESTEIETDLYSINLENSAENLQLLDTTKYSPTSSVGSRNSSRNLPNLSHGSRKSINLRNYYNSSTDGSLMSLPQVAQYMEPLYETFFCPLTDKIMEEPVTIESGVTYDKTAIVEWFDKFGSSVDIFCPKSGQKLHTRSFNANVALKATIDEWKERNEVARIKVARAALSLASTENMILEAMDDLQKICRKRKYNKVQVRTIGIVPLLGKFLDYKSRNVRHTTLELLQQLADDNDGKEMIARTVDAPKVMKMLSSNNRPIRHASASLLLELSNSKFFCDKIGEVSGGILMLITIKLRQSTDVFTSSKVDEILKNLEKTPTNIKHMAEDGYWEPLLNHLLNGKEEDMRMEMACYLGEIVLGPDSQVYVAEKSSSALINMVHGGNSISRSAALKALRQISSYQLNSKFLVEAGIVQVMVEEMFARTIQNEPMNTKNEAAAILANILESRIELENLQVNVHGHSMTSDYIVYNIISWIKNSTLDELNINLIRILLSLMKFPKSSATIVSVVKETETSYNLIELINTPNEELGIASIKLLITLASFMGHTLSDRLCKTRGQPESLIESPSDIARITEKHAISANFLAKLPHQNLTLNLALINQNTVPRIIDSIKWIQRTGTRTSRYSSAYLEGLVGTLVRFTTTLYDFRVLSLVREYNFTALFTEILMRTSSDEVQKSSSIGLENLSNQSVNLSKPPERKKTKKRKVPVFGKCFSNSSKDLMEPLCPVHRGTCSSQDTFCLLEANAVERLLTCLDHDNVEVVKAALSAICTLLDDKVDVDESVKVLHEMNATRHVLNVVKEHREEILLQKSFWVIDKFLVKGGDESISDISEDRLLPTTLISAFHHGDECTRQMAEKILRHLNKIPTFSINNCTL